MCFMLINSRPLAEYIAHTRKGREKEKKKKKKLIQTESKTKITVN